MTTDHIGTTRLGVHKVIGGGPLPPYVLRPHDEVLAAVLDPGVPASRLVVVRGGSSTGKTRAAWEAVRGQLADWQLDYPQDPAALKEWLDAGIPPRTVLWLGELRQYTGADGGAHVLGLLADLLDGEGRLLITTMWPEQWDAYQDAARPDQPPDRQGRPAGCLRSCLSLPIQSKPGPIRPAAGLSRSRLNSPAPNWRLPRARGTRYSQKRPPRLGTEGTETRSSCSSGPQAHTSRWWPWDAVVACKWCGAGRP
jgi:hypothetical protein